MTWHKNGKRYRPEKMVHPSDADAWKYFDGCHTMKAMEAQNVRVALATDGMTAAPYSYWPVFVIPLNLPPGVIFQRQNIFLSLIIPEYSGDNMSVYMETNFKMRVW